LPFSFLGKSELAVWRQEGSSSPPNCSQADLLERYPEQVIIRNTWKDVLEELKNGSSGQSVSIFPNGSLQYIPVD